jgi:hypothetical protein
MSDESDKTGGRPGDMNPDINLAYQEMGTYASRFQSLQATPTALLTELRASPDFAVAVVRADTRPWLQQWFTETDAAWAADTEGTGVLGTGSVGVEWRFEGTHDTDEVFHGLPKTNNDITVEGFSVLRAGPDGLRVRRYVNWPLVFQQLGLTLNWRLPITNTPDPGDPTPHPR